MSRIDQALKIWEGANDAEASAAETTQPSSSFPLHQYPHERLSPHRREDPTPLRSLEPSTRPERPAAATPRRTTTRVAKLPDKAEIQARLVTGPSSTVALEQYRRLAAVLHEEQVQRQLKTVMITSALPQEGKTHTLVNLALTLSESYARRVLVIDADLRWPSLHTVLNVPNDRGLSEALANSRHELSFIEVSGHLSALTAGHPGPTPLLAGLISKRMGKVIEECTERFDWVLIDTSPVGVLPDAQVLARLVGAVLFVIGAGSTPAATVERAIAEIGPDAIIGTILNRVEERRIPEAGYYGQYGTSSGVR